MPAGQVSPGASGWLASARGYATRRSPGQQGHGRQGSAEAERGAAPRRQQHKHQRPPPGRHP
eukprot:9676197-Alexandrium_andersonii.AAC.1